MNFGRKLPDVATYFGSPTTDGFGAVTFATPVLINCRWSEANIKFMTATGDEAVSRAVIHTDQDLDVGGYLYHGELNTNTVLDPSTIKKAYPIRQFLVSPDIANLQFNRRAML